MRVAIWTHVAGLALWTITHPRGTCWCMAEPVIPAAESESQDVRFLSKDEHLQALRAVDHHFDSADDGSDADKPSATKRQVSTDSSDDSDEKECRKCEEDGCYSGESEGKKCEGCFLLACAPSSSPSASPSTVPSGSPSHSPSDAPSDFPSSSPTDSPSDIPSSSPTDSPSDSPSASPSDSPTASPTFQILPTCPSKYFIDFDTYPCGCPDPVPDDVSVSDEWAFIGLEIRSVGGTGMYPRTFDTSNAPTFAGVNPDWLGSPNLQCPLRGPGVGEGGEFGMEGENCDPLNNVLIIENESTASRSPLPGSIIFDFTPSPASAVYEIGVLGVVDEGSSIMVVHSGTTTTVPIEGLGPNSYQVIDISIEDVDRVTVVLDEAASVTHIAYCWDPSPPSPPPVTPTLKPVTPTPKPVTPVPAPVKTPTRRLSELPECPAPPPSYPTCVAPFARGLQDPPAPVKMPKPVNPPPTPSPIPKPTPSPTCLQEVTINFETDADGDSLFDGDFVSYQWSTYNLYISTQPAGGWPSLPRLFQSSPSPGIEVDPWYLETQDENLLLIIQDDSKDPPQDPYPKEEGGAIFFSFPGGIRRLDEICFINLDWCYESELLVISESGTRTIPISGGGPNSVFCADPTEPEPPTTPTPKPVSPTPPTPTQYPICLPPSPPTRKLQAPTPAPTSCTNEVYIDFETDADGNILEHGDYVSYAWNDVDFGNLEIIAQPAGGLPVNARLLDSALGFGLPPPSWYEYPFFLGAPNEACSPSGPGEGYGGESRGGGENCDPLGNILIIPTPDSPEPYLYPNVPGGSLIFDFPNGIRRLHYIRLLNVDTCYESELMVTSGTATTKIPIDGLGPNSHNEIIIDQWDVVQLRVILNEPAAVVSVAYCADPYNGPPFPNPSPVPLPPHPLPVPTVPLPLPP